MKKLLTGFLISVLLMFAANAQQRNSFSLALGTISTQNNAAQPATSLTGQFEIILPKPEENINIYLAVDFSTYLAEGYRLSSCNDCSYDDYSGFDIGLKIRFEPQNTAIPLNLFTGFSRIITKKRYVITEISPVPFYNSPEFNGSRNYISNFWDIGVGLKSSLSDNLFFSAEALTGYSLESDPTAQQGFERFEFNLGLGLKF